LLVCLILAVAPLVASAAEPAAAKKVLSIYWFGKDNPTTVIFEQRIQDVLRSAPNGSVEYYAEYLEPDRFPGEGQELLMRDYLRQRYADHNIDVIIALSPTVLGFLLKYRGDLFPNTPIVYHTSSRASAIEQAQTAGLSAVVVDKAYRDTLDLALKLRPDTKQAFVITGTPDRSGKLEMEVREELKELNNSLEITYLNDRPLEELIAQVKSAPANSVILYVRYSPGALNKTVTALEALSIIANSARVPVYSCAESLLDRGSIGGYAARLEDCGTKAAEVALQIVNGASPQDMPITLVPTIPIFDWRQLRRWGIDESKLPPDTLLKFKELTFWEKYRWRIIGISSFSALETLLIVGLLFLRARRKRVEVALAEKELRLRESQAIAHLGSFHWDVAVNTFTWSDELYRIYGLDPSKPGITYETYLKQVQTDDRVQVRQVLEQSVASREAFGHEYRIIRPTGEERWVFAQGRPVLDADGSLVALQGVCQDITDRKRDEEAMRESEKRARRTLVEQMLAGVVEVAADGKFKMVNQRFCEITGYAEAELLEIGPADILHPDDADRILGLKRRLLETSESYGAEHRFLRKDGSDVWVNSHVAPVRDAQGNVEKAVAVLIDITDRKRAEREREQLLKQEKAARAEAQAANQSKDEFLAMVSHELRSPLNSILGYARLLRGGVTDAGQIKQAVGIIERNGRMQLQLIEDLLDTARIISGKLKLDVQQAPLVAVITAALDTVRPAAQAKDIELISDLDPQAGDITGDLNRLQQVVWNLLSNAIKFTPRSGRVELRMKSVDDHIRVSVSDTGKGIDPEFMPFVFERFRQSDSSSARRFGGLGLGLSLVKQLVELHGGTVEAASEGPGRGATFTVTLPQRAAQTETSDTEHPRPAPNEVRMEATIPLDQVPSLAGVRVLVVDDQEEARELLKVSLGECGAEVIAVSSGVEALAVLADPPGGERPDVLILDINMPDEDGYKVLERVRALEAERGVPQSSRIPAVALTALGRSEDRLKAFAAGFRMHVAKPVEPAELAVVIASVVERLSVGTSA